MKPRRVMLTIEVETDCPLPALRAADNYVIVIDNYGDVKQKRLEVIQASANVVKPEKGADI